MRTNNRVTSTAYPLWLVWLGHVSLYGALLSLPALLVTWLAALVSPSMRMAAQAMGQVVLLPLLYVGLYGLLRHFGARGQNFIWLVILSSGLVAWHQWRKAAAVGTWELWLGAGVCVLYTVGFTTLAVWGWLRNSREKRMTLLAEVDAQAGLHGHGFVRAEPLSGRPVQNGAAAQAMSRVE